MRHTVTITAIVMAIATAAVTTMHTVSRSHGHRQSFVVFFSAVGFVQ